MQIGLSLCLGANLRSGGAPFDPASLFADGEQGAWYEPGPSTAFQDTAGTTPAGLGDPVGRLNDLSGYGNHATQATAASRPTLQQTAGGLWYLSFDGVDDSLTTPVASQGAVGSDNYAAAGMRTNAATGYVLGGTGDKGFELLMTASAIRVALVGASGTIAQTGVTNIVSSDIVYSADWGRSEQRIKGWVNSSLEVNQTGTSGDKAYATTHALGGKGATAPWFSGRLYGFCLIDRQLSTDEQASTEAYMAKRAGVTL